MGITITESAAGKVMELLDREVSAAPQEHEGKAYALRIAVQPGGCAGLRYALYFDDRKLDNDQIETINSIKTMVG